MKTNVLIVCFCAFFLCTDARGETQKQLAFQSGKATLNSAQGRNRTKFSVGEMNFVVDMTGFPVSFPSRQEFCLVPVKSLDEIKNPSQLYYKRYDKRPFCYEKENHEQGCAICAKSGDSYAAIRITNLIAVEGFRQWYDKDHHPFSVENSNKMSAQIPAFKGMEYEWRYWPNVPKTPPVIDENSYASAIEVGNVKPGEDFRIPGIDDCFVLRWELYNGSQKEDKGCWLLRCSAYTGPVEKIGGTSLDFHGKMHLEDFNESEATAYSESLEMKSDTFCCRFPPAPDNAISRLNAVDSYASRCVMIDLVRATDEQVTYKWKFWRVITPEQKLAAEKAKQEAQAEDLRKEAGVKIATISDARKFTLAGAGVRLWWDVNDDNSLSLNYEAAISSAGTLEFAASRKSELADVDADDIASLNFKQLAGKPIAFPTGRIGVFKTSKGCAAVKPTKVENGGKVVRDSETKVTKMVTFETRTGLETEPKRVAQRVTQR